MRRAVLFSTALLASLASVSAAQQTTAVKLSDVAGVWDSKTMVGPNDSVVATTVLTTTADGKGWTMAFPNRTEPVAVRVLTFGGDSVVTEAGPYASYLRAGQMVTLHTIAHYKGDQMWGVSPASYASGDKVTLKVTATRRK